MSGDLDFSPFHLKIGTPLIRALGNIHTNFDVYTFLFSS